MEPTIKMIQTVQGDDVKWRNLGEQELRDYFSFRMDTVVVDSSQEFQTHLGFGGAFTEAAAYVMENASEEAPVLPWAAWWCRRWYTWPSTAAAPRHLPCPGFEQRRNRRVSGCRN